MGLLDIVLPPACAACGRYGDLLCQRCVGALQRASSPADRFTAADPGIVVGDALELAVAAFVHEGPARRALQRLKYGAAGRLAEPLARAAMPAFRELVDHAGPMPLVPIPVHPQRLRQRGYNQAFLLASELGRRTGLPVVDIIERHKATTRQHELGRTARLHNLRGAFALRDADRPPAAVILVDDILTTSATLEACAAVLRAHGAERVWGFAVARET